ncbi:MAG: 2Fe-2S iron-sulfur cluster binding domain-containing protein [Candidatus Poseidoniales archaeon]|nr:2Fe-2S iron-sulfur cluster binding domain-containing protein [Candidatus Poseidoniales archaeon]
MAIVRFFRGRLLLCSVEVQDDEFLVEAADRAGVDIPRNCTSGNCGTCLVRLISGKVPYPDPLPPGLDEFLIEDGGILSCCMSPEGACDIDVIPPL